MDKEEYIKRIEDVSNQLDRLIDSSELIYDQKLHEEIINKGTELYTDIKNSSLEELDKTTLLVFLTAHFHRANMEILEDFYYEIQNNP